MSGISDMLFVTLDPLFLVLLCRKGKGKGAVGGGSFNNQMGSTSGLSGNGRFHQLLAYSPLLKPIYCSNILSY